MVVKNALGCSSGTGRIRALQFFGNLLENNENFTSTDGQTFTLKKL